jgi:hypothetical protein
VRDTHVRDDFGSHIIEGKGVQIFANREERKEGGGNGKMAATHKKN